MTRSEFLHCGDGPTMKRLSALTREVSPAIVDCELTFLARDAIDVNVARRQHRQYREAMAALGVSVTHLDDGAEFPDGVFVEDLAVVLDEGALVTRPGTLSRQKESDTFSRVLGRHRAFTSMSGAATLDGGDVLRIDRELYVGISTRSNREGAEQLRRFAEPLGYVVRELEVKGCLHLKTGCSYLGAGMVLLNPAWVSPQAFAKFKLVEVDPDEPFAANALLVGEHLLYPAVFPRTLAMIRSRGFDVTTVDIAEFQKAEAGITCMSQVFSSP